MSNSEKAHRYEAIQGAVRDFANGRPIADVWQEIVGLAMPLERDENNDPEY